MLNLFQHLSFKVCANLQYGFRVKPGMTHLLNFSEVLYSIFLAD